MVFLSLIVVFSCSENGSVLMDLELSFEEKLQNAVDSGVAEFGGKGLSVHIIFPDNTSWTGTAGVSHGTTQLIPEMLMGGGSITKSFTAVTIMKLAEEGLLSLEDQIDQYLPYFPNVDSTITIRQLLNHTGGIYNITDNPLFWDNLLGDTVNRYSPPLTVSYFTLEPEFPKGTNWAYSNTGYVLLRIIIQMLDDMDIASVYRERIWEPYGLESMYLAGYESLPSNVAHGWFDIDGDGSYEDLTEAGGLLPFYYGIGGGIFSYAEDLAKWAKALYHDKTVLSSELYNEMTEFVSGGHDEPLTEGYGLGAIKFNPVMFNGLLIYGHSGNAPAYSAGSFYLVDYGISIGALTNTEEGEAMNALNYILDAIIENYNK